MTRLRPEQVDAYLALHKEPWPLVLTLLQQANIRDYSIWFHRPELLLFSSFEYHGSDLDRDLAVVAADPLAKRWHDLTAACQVDMGTAGSAWAALDEVFRLD